MKKMGYQKRLAAAFLALILVLSTALSQPVGVSAANKVVGYTDRYDGDVVKVVKQKSYTLVPGVTETDVVLNNQTGTAQVLGYLTTIEPGADVSLKATYAGYYDPDNYNNATQVSKWSVGDWGLTTTTHQIADYEKSTGESVIFATNGDYFNMQTGQPRGSLYINGNCLNPEKDNDEPYFAVLKDGSYVIRDAGTDKSDVLEAVSGPFYLVKDGKNVVPGTSELFPVNSVGFLADGSVVFFMADGRQYPRSVGMTINEQADFLVAQGVQTAIYLDGGGSATVVTRREGEKTYAIRNNPSDGCERNISSGFLLVANSLSDGVFDHASVSPSGDSYTPGSPVAFTAQGVDKGSGAADLPASGLSWVLAADSADKGTIDENTGVFVSNGTLGEVTVELLYEGVKVGEATIKIAEPDSIYFSSASASLDFGESSELGLVVRSENADIFYKDGDFDWTIAPLNAESEGQDLGHMSGNTFVAGQSNGAMNALVTVSYTRADGTVLTASIAVEIGKMPVVAFDFEPTENGPQKGAHFHWGKSSYVDEGVTPGYYGDYPELTVPVKNNYVVEPTYATLYAPYRFTGNYDTSVPAAEIFKANGYSFYLWPNNSITTYCAGNVTTTSEANGGQVRFGEYSMELNFDYASYNGSSNSNYYIRNCAGDYVIEGKPTEVGVWVYADAETYNLAGYSLYTDIAVCNGASYTAKNTRLVHDDVDENGNVVQNSAINWVGWKYCYADLSGLSGYYSPEHPYMLRNGEGMIWLSYQPAAGGGRYSGTFYFDNYRFVYGTNLDDLDNPYFKSFTVNGQSILNTSEVTVDSQNVEITAAFADVNGKNASGIDTTKTTFAIDGQEIGCDGDEKSATTRLELANGLHSVSVTIYDKFGNTNTISSYFTVADGEDVEAAVLSGEDTVVLGSDYQLVLSTKGSVSSLDMTVLQLNSDFGEPVVAAAEGWNVEAVYSITGFKKAKMEIKAQWTGEGAAPADAAVATLSFNVPTNLDAAIDFFTYQVTKLTAVTAEGKSITSAQEKVVLTLSAYYTVNVAVAVSGSDTLIAIVDPDGQPAAGVAVYVNGELIGNTDDNGEIVTSAARNIAPGGTFKVIAINGEFVSFETTVIVMNSAANAEGKPEGLMHTASRNGDTEQVITWFASCEAADAAAVVEYSLNSDLSNAFTVTGTNTLHAFATSKDAAYINTVTITGLEGGKTYYYRAGDGKIWSEVASFTTTAKDSEVSFFVVGDTQMNGRREADVEEIQLLKNLGLQVAGADFGIQTGDYVDNGGNYNMWEEMDATFNEAFNGVDIIHTNGNHEYYGDAYGVAASAIYGMSETEQDYYSVEYGNVYVAVINYSANLKEACAWLIEDAKASGAQWKFLSIHQPAYYTNVNGGSNRFHNAIPAAAEAAGLDAVFSGHDHSYARTMPMTAGQVDEENGIVYFICGDLGEKSRNINYAAYNDPVFHFDCIDQSYDAVTIKVTATSDKLTFTTVDSQGNILDRYEKEDACAGGHEWETYDRTTGLMICGNCGATASAEDELYSGWLTDVQTGKLMYFASGKATKGFAKIENVPYYFDGQGLVNYDGLYSNVGKIYYLIDGKAVTGLYYFNDKYYFFDMDKYTMVTGTRTVSVEESNGLLTEDTEMIFTQNTELKKAANGLNYYYIEGLKSYVGFIKIAEDYYYICGDGHAATGYQYVLLTNDLVPKGTYYFDEEGRFDTSQVKNGIYQEGSKLYYYQLGVKVYAGLIKIDDDYYYVNGKGQVVTGEYTVTKTNGLMPAGKYKFAADGKMILPEPVVVKNGIVTEDGGTFYYVNNKKTYAGLIEIDGSYYYVNGRCEVVTGRYYVSKTNGLMETGWYNFAADGKMIMPEPVVIKNGIVTEDDGITYYYVNDKKTYAGLIQIGEDYYYVNGKCIVVTGKYLVTKTNGLMEKGWYTFAEDGKMIMPEPVVIKNGIVTEDDGIMYYYVNGTKTYAGLICIDGSYYYVNGKCIVVTGRYYVSKPNGLMEKGWYDFADDGKMIIAEIETSDPVLEEEKVPEEMATASEAAEEAAAESEETIPEEIAAGSEEAAEEDVQKNVIATDETAPAEGETAPADGETASEDEEAAPEDGETASEDEEAAPEDGETASENEETAPEDGETAYEDEETAPEDGETASEDEETAPVDGENVPADGESVSEDGVILPETEEVTGENE